MSEEKREPLLSDYDSILADEDTDSDGWRSHYEKSAMGKLQAFYENLIDTGVLMVVKTAHVVQVPFIPREGLTIAGCSICGKPGISTTDQFCPGCGSKFTTAPASPSKSHPK